MNFYISEYRKFFTVDLEYPCIVLTTDEWDDWSIAETLFHAVFYGGEGTTKLGDVKIMTTESNVTRAVIPKKFTELPESYCSLGQSLEFYEQISELPQSLQTLILDGLKDVATNRDRAEKFKDNEVFNGSLLRFSEAEKAFKEAKQYFGGNATKILNFSFIYKIHEASEPHDVELDFTDNILPHRINAFVGKNATGKTKILTELASYISGVKQNRGNFSPARPSFSKIIAISYSAFDELYKPFENKDKDKSPESNEESELFSYKYCGLRNKDGLLSLSELEEHFYQSYDAIVKRGREDEWKKILQNVFEEEHLELIDQFGKSQSQSGLSNLLSSGQNILLSTITDVIAHIEEDSLLLFDEPELHLHPNAIANFMRMYYEILEDFKSFSIISTHSPIILQEIPSKFVRVFSRIDNTPMIDPPSLECFGENISSITNDIFEVRENESNYKTIFKHLSDRHTKEEIIDLFEDDLSFNALAYLNAIFKRKEAE